MTMVSGDDGDCDAGDVRDDDVDAEDEDEQEDEDDGKRCQ